MRRWLLLLAAVAGAGFAATRWPLINDVETGGTPGYPDLQVRHYRADEAAVEQAVKRALARLPRWAYVGSGSGPGGRFVSAVHTTRVLRFEDDVTVRIKREADRTRVSVRSRSRVGTADFGQNARNIRELLAELDREVAR